MPILRRIGRSAILDRACASRSLVERAQMRREADDKQRRTAAAFFGVYQTVNIIVALIVVVLALWLLIFGDGAIPPQVWISALVIAGMALLVAALGIGLNR